MCEDCGGAGPPELGGADAEGVDDELLLLPLLLAFGVIGRIVFKGGCPMGDASRSRM